MCRPLCTLSSNNRSSGESHVRQKMHIGRRTGRQRQTPARLRYGPRRVSHRRSPAGARDAGIYVVHDLAYADITLDGYKAPSIMQIEGAKDHCVEFFSLSKSYNMPGWRVGFMVGNEKLVSALGRLKSYLDYGMFTPIQVAAIAALEGPQECVTEIRDMYQMRRDVLCEGMNAAGWEVVKPKATMFVWAKIMGKLRFLLVSASGNLGMITSALRSSKTYIGPARLFVELKK